MPILESVERLIDREAMLRPGDRVIVAVSGGPDSVALLHLLHRLAPAHALSLHVFHLDHGLRGEASAADAAYVAQLAGELGLPVTVRTLPTGVLKGEPGSLQANARRRRYEEIRSLAAQIGATKVATGHNQDDQAETVLMRLLRGTGPKGLAGITPVRREGAMAYIRPLIATPRREVEFYCAAHKLFPRLDASNRKADYLRNRIRLELMPRLAREYNPAIGAHLVQLAAVIREEDALLEQQAEEAFDRCLSRWEGGKVWLDGGRLSAEPLALARRVVRLAARRVLGPEVDLGLPAVSQVLALASRPEGSRSLDLPAGLRLTVAYGVCCFEHPQGEPLATAESYWPVDPQGETAIPELGLAIWAEGLPESFTPAPEEIDLDADRLPGPLAIRFRRPGDRIWPTGMEGSKKLQDILVDVKVPRSERDRIPLLVAGDEVLWVIGYRRDRRFLAGPATKRTLRVRIWAQTGG